MEFIDIKGLQKENPDIKGYLKIPQTEIAYPVMRSKEPDWYIDRDFYGNKSVCGSIYMDNASYKGGTNLVLYGHNMRSGQMFGTLEAYLDESFLQQNKEIHFITEEEMQSLLALIKQQGGRKYASVS